LIGSVAYYPESYGKNLIRLALEILRKQTIPLATFTSHELITPENVNKVYSQDLLMELKPDSPKQKPDFPKQDSSRRGGLRQDWAGPCLEGMRG
jgi:hypothetical protein